MSFGVHLSCRFPIIVKEFVSKQLDNLVFSHIHRQVQIQQYGMIPDAGAWNGANKKQVIQGNNS